jgi:hypothetical protein
MVACPISHFAHFRIQIEKRMFHADYNEGFDLHLGNFMCPFAKRHSSASAGRRSGQ